MSSLRVKPLPPIYNAQNTDPHATLNFAYGAVKLESLTYARCVIMMRECSSGEYTRAAFMHHADPTFPKGRHDDKFSSDE